MCCVCDGKTTRKTKRDNVKREHQQRYMNVARPVSTHGAQVIVNVPAPT